MSDGFTKEWGGGGEPMSQISRQYVYIGLHMEGMRTTAKHSVSEAGAVVQILRQKLPNKSRGSCTLN
jgi:hypothetical protein